MGAQTNTRTGAYRILFFLAALLGFIFFYQLDATHGSQIRIFTLHLLALARAALWELIKRLSPLQPVHVVGRRFVSGRGVNACPKLTALLPPAYHDARGTLGSAWAMLSAYRREP